MPATHTSRNYDAAQAKRLRYKIASERFETMTDGEVATVMFDLADNNSYAPEVRAALNIGALRIRKNAKDKFYTERKVQRLTHQIPARSLTAQDWKDITAETIAAQNREAK